MLTQIVLILLLLIYKYGIIIEFSNQIKKIYHHEKYESILVVVNSM